MHNSGADGGRIIKTSNRGNDYSMTVAEVTATEQKIEALVGNVENLPTPPLVFAQINRAVNDEMTSAFDIAAILSEDPAMSAKVLKLCNSAYYGLSNPVAAVKQAIVLLGMSEIKNVVLSASALSSFKVSAEDRDYQDSFWRHSLAVAVASRMLIRARHVKEFLEAETAFSAGLLHDIGKMVILCYAPAVHRKIAELSATTPEAGLDAERQIMGLTHSDIGAYLGRHWKLPKEILETMIYHHRPLEAEEFPMYAAVVNLADYLAHVIFDNEQDNTVERSPLDLEIVSQLGISNFDVVQLKGCMMEEYAKSETFLRMASG